MLGIFLIYFIGKQFYELAGRFEKNKWLYAILGVVVYYAVGTILVIILMLLDIYLFEWNLDWESNYGLNLLAIPFGILADYGFYHLLKRNWEKSAVLVKNEIEDIGKPMV